MKTVYRSREIVDAQQFVGDDTDLDRVLPDAVVDRTGWPVARYGNDIIRTGDWVVKKADGTIEIYAEMEFRKHYEGMIINDYAPRTSAADFYRGRARAQRHSIPASHPHLQKHPVLAQGLDLAQTLTRSLVSGMRRHMLLLRAERRYQRYLKTADHAVDRKKFERACAEPDEPERVEPEVIGYEALHLQTEGIRPQIHEPDLYDMIHGIEAFSGRVL